MAQVNLFITLTNYRFNGSQSQELQAIPLVARVCEGGGGCHKIPKKQKRKACFLYIYIYIYKVVSKKNYTILSISHEADEESW